MRVFIAILLPLLFIGCVKYSHEENVSSIPELHLDVLLLPNAEFYYYKQSVSRGDIYLVYFKNDDFYRLNQEHVSAIFYDLKIEPSGANNFIREFVDSPFSLSFDFSQEYTWFRMDPVENKMKVEGIFNDDLGLYLVRFLTWTIED